MSGVQYIKPSMMVAFEGKLHGMDFGLERDFVLESYLSVYRNKNMFLSLGDYSCSLSAKDEGCCGSDYSLRTFLD